MQGIRFNYLVWLVILFLTSANNLKAQGLEGYKPPHLKELNPNSIKNIFDPEDRKPMLHQFYPYSAVLKFKAYKPSGVACTASLVGEDLALTNNHCVEGKETDSMRVYVHYIKGSGEESAKIEQVWKGKELNWISLGQDWALLRLNKKLGAKHGYFGIENIQWDNHTEEKNYHMASFSVNFRSAQTGGVQHNCHIYESAYAPNLYHDCDMGSGGSGAPIWKVKKQDGKKHYRIVGLNFASVLPADDPHHQFPEYSFWHRNLAVKAKRFLGKVKELKGSTSEDKE